MPKPTRPGTKRRPDGPGDYRFLDAVPPHKIAYYAGIFVGEGCFQLSGTPDALKFGITVEMCDEELCHELTNTLGGAFLATKKAGHGRHLASAFRWTIRDGFLVEEVVQRLLHYMTGHKKEQGVLFLAFVKLKLALWQQRVAEKRAVYTSTEQLQLLQAGRRARDFAQGGGKAWRKVWSDYEAKLVMESGEAA